MNWLIQIMRPLLEHVTKDRSIVLIVLPIVLMFLALIFAIWVLGQAIMAK